MYFQWSIVFVYVKLLQHAYGIYNELLCDETLFYKPYAKFFREKGGSLIFEASSGFRTLQSVTNLYLCINGPALFFSELFSTPEAENRFADPKFGVFVHECAYINTGLIRPVNTTRPSNSSLGNDTCPLTLGPPRPVGNFPVFPDFDSRLWGFYLFGDPIDYRLPLVADFFDADFAIRTDLLFQTGPEVPPPRRDTTAFGFSMISIGNTSRCLLIPGLQETVRVDFPPNITEIERQICFRQQQPDDNFASITTITSVGVGSCNENSTHITMTDCTLIPLYTEECAKQIPDVDLSCELLKIVLGAETPEFPVDLRWHIDILRLLDSIYVKLCPQIPHYFVSYVSILMTHYVIQAHNTTGSNSPAIIRRPFWKFIMAALTKCDGRVKALQFDDLIFRSVNQYKEDLVFQNETGPGHTPLRLFYFMEIADREFKFNHIIEMQWIIFATVIGICPKYYNTKTSSISSRFYTMFSEDFLIPLQNFWINDAHNQIFKLYLRQFVNDEIHTKALSCLEASYVQSNTVAFRFLRPLLFSCSEADNFFLELPTPEHYIRP